MSTRYAVYFVPPPDDPLCRRGQAWLGRDAFTGTALDLPAVPGVSAEALDRILEPPRRYGFHATLKAPFRLHEDAEEAMLVSAFDAFCAATPPAAVEGLRIDALSGFLALVCREPSAEVDRLADCVVAAFDGFRAPLSEAERQRRRPGRLTARQRRQLDRWGYPWVGADFTFHMTLTGQVEDQVLRQRLRAHLEDRIGASAKALDRLGHLALFRQLDRHAPFLALRHRPLEGAAWPQDAPSTFAQSF
ncbi:MAG: DUF1045 domain-containing protein [Azospirillaceae bacterium]